MTPSTSTAIEAKRDGEEASGSIDGAGRSSGPGGGDDDVLAEKSRWSSRKYQATPASAARLRRNAELDEETTKDEEEGGGGSPPPPVKGGTVGQRLKGSPRSHAARNHHRKMKKAGDGGRAIPLDDDDSSSSPSIPALTAPSSTASSNTDVPPPASPPDWVDRKCNPSPLFSERRRFVPPDSSSSASPGDATNGGGGSSGWIDRKQNIHSSRSAEDATMTASENAGGSEATKAATNGGTSGWVDQKGNSHRLQGNKMPQSPLSKEKVPETAEAMSDPAQGELFEDNTISLSGSNTSGAAELLEAETGESSERAGYQPHAPGAYAVQPSSDVHSIRRDDSPQDDSSLTATRDDPPPLDHAIAVEATLVAPEEDEEARNYVTGANPRRPSYFTTAVPVVQQKLKCNAVDCRDRRVRWGLFVLIAVFAALAAGIGVAVRKGESSAAAEAGVPTDDLSDSEGPSGPPPPEDDGTDWADSSSLRPSSPPSSAAPKSSAPTPEPTLSPEVPSWELLGSHIDGDGISRNFGSTISMSDDGSFLAASFRSWRIKAAGDNEFGFASLATTGSSVALVFKFEEDLANGNSSNGNGDWRQVEEIFLPNVRDRCDALDATSVSMSGNGQVLAVAARGCDSLNVEIFVRPHFLADILSIPESDRASFFAGSNDTDFTAILGSIIIAPTDTPGPLTTLISKEGNMLILDDGTGVTTSYLGQKLQGKINLSPNPLFDGGKAPSLSADGTTLALASRSLSTLGDDIDIATVYKHDTDSDDWTQLGPAFGHGGGVIATAMSADGRIVAVGGSSTDVLISRCPGPGCSPNPGRVRVYRLDDDSGNWTRMGNTLMGDSDGDNFGGSVSLTEVNETVTLAVGSSFSDAGGSDRGLVRIFRFDEEATGEGGGGGSSGRWSQLGQDIPGSQSGNQFGSMVALSRTGTPRMAVSSPMSRERGNDAGRVSAFQWNDVGV